MSRSSGDVSVMDAERRGRAVKCRPAINQEWEELDGRGKISWEVV